MAGWIVVEQAGAGAAGRRVVKIQKLKVKGNKGEARDFYRRSKS